MTIRGFQHAMVALIQQPALVRRLAAGDTGVVSSYPLTGREQRRLAAIVRQPGIWVCCSLTRASRFEPIAESFPMTCVLLEPHLRGLLDELWEVFPPSDYQLNQEVELFMAMVETMLGAGTSVSEYLAAVFGYETACWTLAQELRKPAAQRRAAPIVVDFEHPPDLVLEPLGRLVAPPPGLQRGQYRVEVRLDAAGDLAARTV